MASSQAILSSLTTRRVAGAAVVGVVGFGIYTRFMTSVAYADSGAPPKAFGSGPAFLSLRLLQSEDVNHNTKRLRFALPSGDHVSGLGLTSALLTYSWPKGCWLPCVRPYTPISASDEPGIVEFLVKKYPNGKQSTYLHSLQPGESLRFVTAIPGYKWQTPGPAEESAKPRSITLIAGGAGITPMYQLIQGILLNDATKDASTRITLVFGVNTDADVLLRPEFESLERQFPGRFRAVYTVSNPIPGSAFRKGYVTKELLKEVGVGAGEGVEKVFVCGPPSMETALVGKRSGGGILGELGFDNGQIHRF